MVGVVGRVVVWHGDTLGPGYHRKVAKLKDAVRRVLYPAYEHRVVQ